MAIVIVMVVVTAVIQSAGPRGAMGSSTSFAYTVEGYDKKPVIFSQILNYFLNVEFNKKWKPPTEYVKLISY